MKRGDVVWILLEGRRGGEVKKSRPAVIVSNDASNKYLNRIQVVPLTSRIGKVYPSEALVEVRGEDHKAMADQLMTVSKQRVDNQMGRVSEEGMLAIELAIRIQLGMA
ncbi:MAG: type II toxin-antitoxin system PemK/MazF family toxin [Bacteroidota bacterium]|nr:type II toxin-antitoxin system PemK/MazF family toxin [Bacteroidota bacterium]